MPRLASVWAAFAVCSALCGCGRDNAIVRLEWPAMGTVAAVQVRSPASGTVAPALRDCVRRVFSRVQKLLDAHDPGSELSRLARLDDAGVLAGCDPLVRPCYEAAFRLRDETGGRFDPRWRGPDTLDLGAIAKGFAADLAADAVRKLDVLDGCDGLLIDIGGNLLAAKGGWKVSVLGSRDSAPFCLEEGAAVATSSDFFRGKHIFDAKTGLPATPAIRSVSVVHPSSAMIADGLSTFCYISGDRRDKAEDFVSRHHPDARILWSDR